MDTHPTRPARLTRLVLAVPLLLTGAALAACAGDPGATDPAGDERVRTTPRGLAAAALAHLDEHEVAAVRGGLVDMEDTREVTVRISFRGDGGVLTVTARDPSYLPGDHAVDEQDCSEPVVTCTDLDDGSLMMTGWAKAGDLGPGAFGVALVSGEDRSVEVLFEAQERDPALSREELAAIAADPLVGWTTTAAVNAAGEDVRMTVADRTDRATPGEGSDALLQPMTARGLAAAVVAHLDGYRVLGVQAGEGDDPAGLTALVSVRRDGVRGTISVTLAQPGDGEEYGAVRRLPAFSDDNADGYTLLGGSTRADGSTVVLWAEFYGPDGMSVEQGTALAEDPAIGWATDPAVLEAGERLEHFSVLR